MKFWTMLARSCRLRCPRCGGARLFTGWFAMRSACDQCGLQFHREPGYYLGSIYFNYGLTALIVTVTFFALFFTTAISSETLLAILTAFCVLFPLWFFRYARSLWLGMDEFFDPQASHAPPAKTKP